MDCVGGLSMENGHAQQGGNLQKIHHRFIQAANYAKRKESGSLSILDWVCDAVQPAFVEL